MKKSFITFLIISLFLISCSVQNTSSTETTLSDLQIQACNTADEAGTCESRLPEVGIVLSEDCCKVLGKCCWININI